MNAQHILRRRRGARGAVRRLPFLLILAVMAALLVPAHLAQAGPARQAAASALFHPLAHPAPASHVTSTQSTSGGSLSGRAQTHTVRHAHARTRDAKGRTRRLHGLDANVPDDWGGGYSGFLTYQGGTIQHNPTFYAIFWLPSGDKSCPSSGTANSTPCHYEPGIIDGDFGNSSTGYLGYSGLMDRFLKDVGSTGQAMVASQYYDTTSGYERSLGTSYTFGGDWHDTNAYPHGGTPTDPLTTGDIAGAVNDALAANPSWKDGDNSTFFVFTPLGVESCNINCVSQGTPNVSSAAQHYCAYHSAFDDVNGHHAIFANMPEVEYWNASGAFKSFTKSESCGSTNALPNGDIYADNEFSVLAHELFEAATDPLRDSFGSGTGWTDNNFNSGAASGAEIGDPCMTHYGFSRFFGPSNTNVNGHLYNIQQLANSLDYDFSSGAFAFLYDQVCSNDITWLTDGSYYFVRGPYTATAGVSTGSLNLAMTVLAPNDGCCGTAKPSIDWGDGTATTEPGGDTGCIICVLTGSHTYASEGLYKITVTYWTGIHFCGCFLDSDTQRSVSLYMTVFPAPPPPTDSLTITADNQTMTYGGTATFTASYSGLKSGDTSSVVTGLTCDATDGQGNPVNNTTPPGTYTITCSGATAQGYTITYTTGTLTINPAPLTITADNESMTYGGTVPALTWKGSGWVNGDSDKTLSQSPNTAPTCTAAHTTEHVSGSPYKGVITCSGAAIDNYVIGYAAGDLTITPANLTITADNKSMTYGGTAPTVTWKGSGWVNGDSDKTLSQSPNTKPTCTAGHTTDHVAGSPYVGAITCSGAADSDYAVTYAAGNLTITRAPLTITADDQTMTYGSPLPALTVRYKGLVNGDTSSAITGMTCATTATAYTGTAGSGSHVGSYSITCASGTDSDYAITYGGGMLTVTPVPLEIDAKPQTMAYGGPIPALTMSYKGLANGDSATTTAPSCTTTATAASHVTGNPYSITCSGAMDSDYSPITYKDGTLTVTPVTLTITADTKTVPYGHVPTYTWTGQGWVNGDSPSTLATGTNTPPICGATVNGAAVSATTAPGVYSGAIICQGATDPDYAIGYHTGTLTIDPVLSLDEQGLPTTTPHQATLDGQTVTLPDTNVELAYGSTHEYGFPATVIDASSGVVYFTTDAGLSGAVTANIHDTAIYQTMAQIVSAVLSAGGIDNGGIANALTSQFSAVQADLHSGNTAQALTDLHSFAAHVLAQSGKHITTATAQTLLADAQMVYTKIGGAGSV